MKETRPGEKFRTISIAVANWLCGTLEGIASDPSDKELVTALDTWLQQQEYARHLLYIGTVVCEKCGKQSECLVVEATSGSIACGFCGNAITFPFAKRRNTPHTKATSGALKKILQQADFILTEIDDFRRMAGKKNVND